MSITESLGKSVGKKAVMAITGLLLFGFVIGHLLGNLLIFCGPEALNKYGQKLSSLGGLLWVIRAGLLTIVLAHIFTAIKLVQENRAARPVAYAHKANIQSSYAARTMAVSGFIILAFIIYHLLHFTVRVTNPDISHMEDIMGHHDIYSMVVLSFQKVYISLAYIIAQILLAFHLSHGLASLLQSLGIYCEENSSKFKRIAQGIAFVIFAGYVSIPVSVLLGWVTIK